MEFPNTFQASDWTGSALIPNPARRERSIRDGYERSVAPGIDQQEPFFVLSKRTIYHQESHCSLLKNKRPGKGAQARKRREADGRAATASLSGPTSWSFLTQGGFNLQVHHGGVKEGTVKPQVGLRLLKSKPGSLTRPYHHRNQAGDERSGPQPIAHTNRRLAPTPASLPGTGAVVRLSFFKKEQYHFHVTYCSRKRNENGCFQPRPGFLRLAINTVNPSSSLLVQP